MGIPGKDGNRCCVKPRGLCRGFESSDSERHSGLTALSDRSALVYPKGPPTRPYSGAVSMNLETPKQAFAAREAHEALIELKRLVDEATRLTHEAELESFRVAIHRDPNDSVRKSLQNVVERVKSPDLDRAILMVREKLEVAL